ncbi:MAG: TatD family hydrolase [Bacilli bacterium]
MLIDTHTHLNDKDLYSERDNIIVSAKEVGVKQFIVVGFDYDSSFLALDIAREYEEVYAAIGIHPTEIDSLINKDEDKLFSLLNNDKVVALGEIGLDYHWEKDEDKKKRQREYFIHQIEIANKYNKPVIIHSREASKDTYDILKTYPVNKKGVIHCFSMSKEMMKEFVKLGYYIGLDGPVTFKNAKEVIEVAKYVPLDRLLLETDCPYMAPTPFRGKRNEPKYLPYIADKIAEIKGIDKEEVKRITSSNAKKLFHV